MLWEKFQWILPLYMKPISFQSKASVVCSVTTAVFIDYCLKKLNVFSQHIGKKTNEYLNSAEQIPRSWNVDRLSVLSTSWDITQWCSINLEWKELMECMSEHTGLISSLLLLLVQTQAARWKATTPEQLTDAHLYLDLAKSGYVFHAIGNVMLMTQITDAYMHCINLSPSGQNGCHFAWLPFCRQYF